jgi:hypothetical protein
MLQEQVDTQGSEGGTGFLTLPIQLGATRTEPHATLARDYISSFHIVPLSTLRVIVVHLRSRSLRVQYAGSLFHELSIHPLLGLLNKARYMLQIILNGIKILLRGDGQLYGVRCLIHPPLYFNITPPV